MVTIDRKLKLLERQRKSEERKSRVTYKVAKLKGRSAALKATFLRSPSKNEKSLADACNTAIKLAELLDSIDPSMVKNELAYKYLTLSVEATGSLLDALNGFIQSNQS